jgi:hypothetical protein
MKQKTRLGGGDRHPNASRGELLREALKIKSLMSRSRNGDQLSGSWMSTIEMIAHLHSLNWQTNSLTDRSFAAHVQTNLSRHMRQFPGEWEKRYVKNRVQYRYVGESFHP